jgi:hypothetical protein
LLSAMQKQQQQQNKTKCVSVYISVTLHIWWRRWIIINNTNIFSYESKTKQTNLYYSHFLSINDYKVTVN